MQPESLDFHSKRLLLVSINSYLRSRFSLSLKAVSPSSHRNQFQSCISFWWINAGHTFLFSDFSAVHNWRKSVNWGKKELVQLCALLHLKLFATVQLLFAEDGSPPFCTRSTDIHGTGTGFFKLMALPSIYQGPLFPLALLPRLVSI